MSIVNQPLAWIGHTIVRTSMHYDVEGRNHYNNSYIRLPVKQRTIRYFLHNDTIKKNYDIDNYYTNVT